MLVLNSILENEHCFPETVATCDPVHQKSLKTSIQLRRFFYV